MKFAVRLVAGAALLAAVAAATVAIRLWRSVPPRSGREALPGLGAEVEIRWDSAGIPHIVARSDADAFAALGYLHARERLWQMETMRRTAEGRLAEVLGPAALDADRFLRRLDIPFAAARCAPLLPAETRELVAAYLRGVNRWIAAHSRPLPPEFQVLRFAPEPWTARQAFELGRLMAWDLVNAGNELALARAEARVGPARVRDLFPRYPDDAPVILPRGSGHWARPRGLAAAGTRGGAASPSAFLPLRDIPAVPPLAAELLDAASAFRASNSWALGPSRTRSGKPILANDPHLTLRAPSLWYLVAIESPGFHVVGATIPGIPAVILGHNRRIAWGLTNAGVDDVDYVIERLSADSSKVLTPSGWTALTVERDSIRVRGSRAVAFTLRRGPHGPLAGRPPGGRGGDGGGDTTTALAMRWNALDPSDELTALLGVDRASDWTAFRTALRGVKAPEQNWIYADVDGNIGYQLAGAVPVRRSGQGLLPTPGWTDEGVWERYLDFEELPWALNPPEGFIVTANNRVVGPEYPHFLTANWELPYRAERIRELIAEGGRLTVADVARMQMDTLDVFARWARELAAAAADRVGRADAARALRAWDGTAGADRPEPSLFWTWYRALQRRTFENELPDGFAPESPLQAWMRSGDSPWLDAVRPRQPETLAGIADEAMREALRVAWGVRWGLIHQTLSAHPLGSVKVLDWLLRLDIGPAPRAGSLYTVDVADFAARRPPFLNTHGPSFRQVADLADLAHARMILTTGESGNPLSGRYRDQVAAWYEGRLAAIPMDTAELRTAGRLVLQPAR